MTTQSFSHEEEARLAAQALLKADLKLAAAQPILFLSSGGSCLHLLEGLDASDFSLHHLTLGILDERITTDLTSRNLERLLLTDFFKQATAGGCSVLDWRQAIDEPLEQQAQRFETALRTWINQHTNGQIIATLGLGADGHTAGVLPLSEDRVLFSSLFDGSAWVAGYDAKIKSPFPYRVTVTLSFLREHVTHAILFVTGKEKRAALDALLAPEGALETTPGRIIQNMKDVKLVHT